MLWIHDGGSGVEARKRVWSFAFSLDLFFLGKRDLFGKNVNMKFSELFDF